MMFGIWILWIVLIVLIVWGVRVFTNNTAHISESHRNGKSAADILRERYARGEIDKRDFDDRMQTLSH